MTKLRSIISPLMIILALACCGLFLLGCSEDEEDIDPTADTDGDGILDILEVNDIGKSLGLDRYRKDIVVEVDYFVRSYGDSYGRTSYRFEDNGKHIVENMFNQAPVSNPKGNNGISIHILVDDAIPNDSRYLGWENNDGSYNWTEFQVFKDVYFTSELKQYAHYCLFVKDIGFLYNGVPRGISGISRNGDDFFAGAQDFIVALGSWSSTDSGQNVWDKLQAGTFAHELGHNLGLGHGGQSHMNYKPNYLSIMTYSFQTAGLVKTGMPLYSTYDYDRLGLPDLYEVTPDQNCQNLNNCAPALNEAYGLGPGAAGYGTIYYYYTNDFHGVMVYDATANIDWNHNGHIDGSYVAANINQDTIYCYGSYYHNYTRLVGNTDWNKLVYTAGGAIGSTGAGIPKTGKMQKIYEPISTNWDRCISYDQHRQLIDNLEVQE